MTRFGDLLRALAAADVSYVVVGGVAAAAHGSPRSTQELLAELELLRGRLRRSG